jgi:DNA polymerase-3 subunit epsilon
MASSPPRPTRPPSLGRVAPTGEPWTLPLDAAPLAFLDLEMTGLEPAVDRVVEVCVERVVGGQIMGRIETLVRAGDEVDPVGAGMAIHGIDRAELLAAPRFAEVAGDLAGLLDGAIMVAHAAAWDVAFLEAEFARCGEPFRSRPPITQCLDTLTLSRRAFALPSHSLDNLATSLGIPRGRAHRAGDDVRVMRTVFDRCVAELAPKTPLDLWEVRIAERKARPSIVAECQRAAEDGRIRQIHYRPSRRGAENLQFCVTSVDAESEPPRVKGYDAQSRARRELRADRILGIDEPPNNA